jgi:hypothetical protein
MNWSRPPRALRKAKLDNIALVPASLLPYKARYQAIANRLPQGDVLIVLPDASPAEQRLLERATALFRARGRRVTVLPASRVDPPSCD